MKRLALVAATLAIMSPTALFTTAQAQPAAPPPAAALTQDCLRIGMVYDFKPVAGNRSLIVIDRARRKYKVNFMGVCHDLQFNMGLGFRSHGTGQLSCIEKGDYVMAHDPAIPFNQCPIQSVEAYTPAMEQADAAAAEAAKAAH